MFDNKYRFAVLFIAALLVLGLTLPACTCQKPSEPEEPSAPSGQPYEPEEPSALPEQPSEAEEPSAPSGQPAALSFEAAEYTNDEYGFSVKYPKDWEQQPSDTTLFYAAAPAQVPILMISVAEGATLAEAVVAAVEETGGSSVKIKSQSETTLADGTKAIEGIGTFKHSMAPMMTIEAFVLGAMKDDKWVIVAVATVGMIAKFDEAKFSEIAHTLEFK
jgi:hypothetical protein